MNTRPSSATDPSVPSRPSRRAALGVALGGLAALAGLGLASAKPKRKPKGGRRSQAGARRKPHRRKQRRPRFKVLTRTFISTGPIAIPEEGAATPYPSIIQVGGLRAGRILDVNVTLSELSHTYPDDLEIVLVAPNGQTAVGLLSRVGGDDDIADVTLTFDDQAATYLPFDAQIVGGTFKPTLPGAAPHPETAALRAFNGLNPNGAWRLYVADNSGGDEGSLAGWALTIKARVRT